jgi:hypothetical protein
MIMSELLSLAQSQQHLLLQHRMTVRDCNVGKNVFNWSFLKRVAAFLKRVAVFLKPLQARKICKLTRGRTCQ